MSKKYWLQPVDTDTGTWQKQIQDLTGSNTFCILPWIHLATRPNGDMRLCCVSNSSGAEDGNFKVGLVKKENGRPANLASDRSRDAFNNGYMQSVRNLMLSGQIPKSCKKCFDEESKGLVSKRLWETHHWYHSENIDIKKLADNTEKDGKTDFVLNYLDLRLGHECNLKCVMCSPHDSSRWIADHKKIFPVLKSETIKQQIRWNSSKFNNRWHESQEFWKEIYQQVPNIRQIYFAGGEPLATKQHFIFLDYLITSGYSDQITLRYNSNGLLLSKSLIEKWTNFKKIKFGFSLDGIGDRLAYIRYPTNWNLVEEQLAVLDASPDNIEINLALTVQLLNIKHIPDVIKWKVRKKFKKINMSFNSAGQQVGGGLLSTHLLWIPTWLSIRVLPAQDKKDVLKRFDELAVWLKENYTDSENFWYNNPYGWSRWQSFLDFMTSEDQSYLLPDFVEYVQNLDKIRNTNFSNIFPEIAHLLDT